MPDEHRAMDDTDTAMGSEESNSDEAVHATEPNTDVQEAELLVQKLNELGHGEQISKQEFLDYLERLPSGPRWIDLEVKLEDEDLDRQEDRHGLYCLRYYKYKFSQQASREELNGDKLKEDHHPNLLHKSEDLCIEEFLEEDLHGDKLKEDHDLSLLHKSEDDCNEEFLEEEEEELYVYKSKEDSHLSLLHKSEDDCDAKFLEEEGFFRRFEKEGTFDWAFHRNYSGCALLNDYQCIVPKQYYDGAEYSLWSEYHEYLHSYKIEQEYVKYCEELFKQLKWMEDYLKFERSSIKGRRISSRGVYQAVKIAATDFQEITPNLAYNGFFECRDSMSCDRTCREVSGVNFQIWRRVTRQMKSFRDALEEVYNLNRFPSRQHMMKVALEFDFGMKMMKEDFSTYTAGITPEVEDDKAQKLISETFKELVKKTKYYEQYIRRKIDIARVVGILDSEE